MSRFRERFGNLTVEQVLALNEAAIRTCEWETTSCGEQVKSLVDWEADTGYERGKCNKTPEEIVDNYGETLKRLEES